ncbi:MAG TPA: hypothetical protein VEQ60_22665 [Longimicrobium sp.]|nr:hypothetical protein [Longimicrobium sp.]
MLPPRLTPVLLLTALFCAAPLAAQGTAAPGSPTCTGGPADDAGARIAVTVEGTPEQAAELLGMALQLNGFTVTQPLRGAGAWTSAPHHIWIPDYLAAMATGQPHPGVQLSGDIQPRGDSTEISLVARTLCSLGSAAPAGPLGSTEDLLEQFSAYFVMHPVGGFDRRDGRAGTFSLDLPPQVADLRRVGQRPVPPRAVMLHYAGPDELAADAYFYLGPVPTLRCTPSCHEVEVRREVSGYLRTIPLSPLYQGATSWEMTKAEALAPGPGDGWGAGYHMAHRIVRDGNTIDTHYYVYAFPDYLMKVRGTFVAGSGRAERLQAFVDAAVAGVIRTEGGPPPPTLPTPRS